MTADLLLPGFPVVIDIPVAWGEMDAFGHVNNVVYFRYFECARIAYFERLGVLGDLAGAGHGPILARTHCRFRVPLTYPDRLRVAARVSEVREDRFTMHHVVASQAAGRIAAEGDGLVVWYDYRAARKTPLPPAVRERLAALEAGTA